MSGKHISPERRDAAIADYLASGEPFEIVGARHGVSRSALNSWVRQADPAPKDELALSGGRWVPNGRGVMVWEAAA